MDTHELHRAVRAELRGLPKELAEIVASHLVVAGHLIDTDPERAYAHAEAARRRAARLPIVREAAAETAYAAGEYAASLNEYRTLRRMTGTQDYLPVMADCERALGRPQAALRLAKESRDHELDPGQQVEMRIVEAGARADLGQLAEAERVLKSTIDTVSERESSMRTPAVRLRYAYADLLLSQGDSSGARQWFAAAAALDRDAETDAQERVDALDGLEIEFDPSDEAADQDAAGEGEVGDAADASGRDESRRREH